MVPHQVEFGQQSRTAVGIGPQAGIQKPHEFVFIRIAVQVEFAAIELVGDAIQIVAHGQCGGRGADHAGGGIGDAVQVTGRIQTVYPGVGSGNVEGAVIVRTAPQPLIPWFCMQRFQVVPVRQGFDRSGRKRIQHVLEASILPVVAGAVEFEILKQEQELFEQVHAQSVVDGVQGVGHDADDALIVKIPGQIVNAGPHFLNLNMLRLGDIQSQNMDFTALIREIGRDLLADEGTGQMGNFQGPADGVVVRYGYMGHAAVPGDLIDIDGLGEAFRAADFFQ